jgi:hypothetical protein
LNSCLKIIMPLNNAAGFGAILVIKRFWIKFKKMLQAALFEIFLYKTKRK